MIFSLKKIELFSIPFPIVKKGDNIAELIVKELIDNNIRIQDGDIFVIAHTIISRAEGNEYYLPSISPSFLAEIISRKTGKDPSLVQLILNESSSLEKVQNRIIISKHRLGWISANAAVDQSNSLPNHAVTLPTDPEKTARKIGVYLKSRLKKTISVLISDTHGRALRRGAINIAIGSYNFSVIDDARGRRDIFGNELKSTLVALADEVCSAAELLMGQADEMSPVVVVRGFNQRSPVSSIYELQYEDNKRLFK